MADMVGVLVCWTGYAIRRFASKVTGEMAFKKEPGSVQPASRVLGAQDQGRELLISHLYDIAVDPARYEQLVDWWDDFVHPAWPSDTAAGRLDFDAQIEAHFLRASVLLDTADSRRSADTVVEVILDLFRTRAAFVVDSGLVVRAATQAARSWLGVAPGEALPASETGTDADGGLRAALIERLKTGSTATGVYQLRGPDNSRPSVVYLRRQVLPGGVAGLVVVVADFVWQPGATQTVRAAFDLTEAETDVARLVAQGFSAKEIARHRAASPETVRKQIQSVFRKTNTRTQVELSRAVLSVADIAVFTEDHAGAKALPSPGLLAKLAFRSTTGDDGRRLDYLVLGDPAGRPVLYLAQDYGFVRLPSAAEAEAASFGLRLITPVYAGYGACDPHPPGADYAGATVRDLCAVLEAEKAATFPVLSSMMTYHAVNLIAAAPGRVRALVQVPATFPLETRAQFERMDKWHRFINGAARFTPGVLPFMVKAGFHLARRLGKSDFLNAVYGTSPGDLATIADPHAFEAIAIGSEVALGPACNAHRPFARQVIARVAEPWGDRLRALEGQLPVIALQGVDDPYCPPETLAEMRESYPWMQIEAVDNAGELLLFSHWRRALELIRPYA